MDTIPIPIKDAQRIKETLKLVGACVLILCIILAYLYWYSNSLLFNIQTGCEKTCIKQEYHMPDCPAKCYAYYTIAQYQTDDAFAPPPPK